MNLYESIKGNLKESSYYNWKRDIEDMENDDDIIYGYAENMAEQYPDQYGPEVDDVLSQLINVFKISKDSALYQYLIKWYGSEEKLLQEVRNVWDTPNAIYFETGTGYSIFDADLLGGNADGETERKFDKFVNEQAMNESELKESDPNDDPDWHHEVNRDPDSVEVKHKNPGKQTVSGDKVTSDDLNGPGVNYEIDIDGDKYYLTCFWSSNEPFPSDDWDEEAAEWEDPDDVWGIYYEIYDEDGSEGDGGELLTYDLGEWDAIELCKDMLGLSGYETDNAKIKHLDNGNYEDVISFNESEIKSYTPEEQAEAAEKIIDMKDACYDIAEIIDNRCGDRIQDLPNGDGVLRRDDFDEEFVFACEKVLGLSDADKDKFWEDGDAWEYENYVRGILSYMGYETIYENDDERGVDEGDLVKLRGISEAEHKSLGRKLNESERVSVRLATNIDWETDGDKEALKDLPKEVELPDWVSEDEVADYLSDEYGYLVNDVDVKTVSEDFGDTAIKYLDYELEDDGTSEGGISHAGETLREFIAEVGCGLKPTSSMKDINAALEACGIKPIKESDDVEVIGFNNQFNTTVKQARIDHKNKNYKTGSFKMINDKKMRRKDFYNKLEELNKAGYKEVKEADDTEDLIEKNKATEKTKAHHLKKALGLDPDLKIMSYGEWKNSEDYWGRLNANYGIDSETDLETHGVSKQDIWDAYREYIVAVANGGKVYTKEDYLDEADGSDNLGNIKAAVEEVADDFSVDFSNDTPFEMFYAPEEDEYMESYDYVDFFNAILSKLGVSNLVDASVSYVSDGKHEITFKGKNGEEIVLDIDAWDDEDNVIDNVEAMLLYLDNIEEKPVNESEDEGMKEFDLEFWVDEEARDQGFGDTLYIDADDVEEAIAEARKYYNRENWASCELLDDNGEVIFGIYPEEDGGEVDYRKENALRESVKKDLISVMESNNISINGMTAESLK